MGEVREENERLKKLLAKIVVDYKSLEKKISSMDQTVERKSSDDHNDDGSQDLELVSLTLGNWTSNKRHDDDTKKHTSDTRNERRKVDGGLDLGLDCKFSSDSMKNSTLENDNNEEKEEDNIETLSPSQGLKSKRKASCRENDELESLQQPQVKKTRVCIRSRCDTPTMNDGCQWRKYGQKIAKGNPCPRAYYRCTVSQTCPVRKQVQRCAEDMSILITTYEGTHNHPLPLAATAMASATSAAASMIKTGSLTSQAPLMGPTNHPTPTTTSSPFSLHNSSNFFNTNPRFSIPNPTMITSASSHLQHPTVTLDLTTPNTGVSPFNHWLPSSSSSSSRMMTTSIDFTSSTPATSSWANGYFNYGTLFPYNSMNSRLIHQNPSNNTNNNNSQQSLNETIAAVATKAIASNPNLQSVLAAAISSYVGNNKGSLDQKIKSSSPPRIDQSSDGGGSLMLFPTSDAAGARDHIS